MRKGLVVGVGILLSWVVAASVSAQTVDKKTLSLEAALRVAARAADEARARAVGVVIAVVDDGGHLIVLHRMDDTQVASVNVGIGKARTAAIYRRPSRDFEEQIRGGRVAALALADSTPLLAPAAGVPASRNNRARRCARHGPRARACPASRSPAWSRRRASARRPCR
jgi:glc operon protein GlcG